MAGTRPATGKTVAGGDGHPGKPPACVSPFRIGDARNRQGRLFRTLGPVAQGFGGGFLVIANLKIRKYLRQLAGIGKA